MRREITLRAGVSSRRLFDVPYPGIKSTSFSEQVSSYHDRRQLGSIARYYGDLRKMVVEAPKIAVTNFSLDKKIMQLVHRRCFDDE